MKNLVSRLSALVAFATLSTSAYAAVGVPEIDAGSAAIAVGLLAGVVALIRERR